uniref:Myosin light chain kinase 3 n=1 Tax=Coturnix japonica TaxID=93934 RepID=A0A8C2TRI7_COTJA
MSAGSLDVAEGNALTKLQPMKVNNFSIMDKKLNLLNEKMDKLLCFQEDLTGKLQGVKAVEDIEKGINKLTVSREALDETGEMEKGLKVSDNPHQTDTQSICSEVLKLMKIAQLDALKHKERLAKIEGRIETLDKVITLMGEVLKNSKVVDFILKGVVPWKKGSLLESFVEAKEKLEESGSKPKHVLSNRGTQTESSEPSEGVYHSGRATIFECWCEGDEAAAMMEKCLSDQVFSSLDDSPSPPAPFEHRIVSVKLTEVTACYSVCRHEVLGGGRFGQVHKCTEVSTGLNLAAKIIKVKGAKEKEEVKNEINIMNQLNHVNLIQLYDAFEAKNNVTLIMEYLDGGELFDRITDENYNLTELDAILFTKQICEGVHYLHQHYILHLDLKPENILCVSRTGNQIKIIDFGLARRYKPREKLKVNFGTPEFLAPEVVNYDFVSYPTDMWSVGVITYMLLSGLSPFLGETDAETMNYVVNCNWDFDAEAFEQLSEEAKDFISRLLVKEKSYRMSATQCLKHEWLNNLPAKAKKFKLRLKSQLLLQSYIAQRKWKKHFYVVAAANRLKRFQSMSVKLA